MVSFEVATYTVISVCILYLWVTNLWRKVWSSHIEEQSMHGLREHKHFNSDMVFLCVSRCHNTLLSLFNDPMNEKKQKLLFVRLTDWIW